ncbi:ROK family glucokinase [Nocardioides panacisoli]|uniref:ROK family glucokinase n=1 Tax=Nocardioides panacisoli TaxID=627624 RepID=UPI001C63771C|nr:ROK family glucokinase [Nocardioides panacisoli]QYJ04666.1 ROK family glucokinase [Nocardioides panacisoli]
MTATCGIDIGGTKIAGGVVDDDGVLLAEGRTTSPATDGAALQRAVADLVADLGRDHDLAALGVGAAGYVAADRSTVLFAPNIAWRDAPLGADLARLTGLRVVVENDANAAAWGEFVHGAGRDVQHQLMVTVGTGVGGGIIAGGQLLRGGFGVAAEIGHLRLVPDGERCGCGKRGCLEAYASGTALVRRARAAVAAGDPATAGVLDRAGGDPASVTGPLLTAAARDGDRFAVDQFTLLGRWLGLGLASLASVLDPEVIVVGGGVGAAGDLLLAPAREAFGEHLTGRHHRPEAEIRTAELGGSAGIIGAADLARA